MKNGFKYEQGRGGGGGPGSRKMEEKEVQELVDKLNADEKAKELGLKCDFSMFGPKGSKTPTLMFEFPGRDYSIDVGIDLKDVNETIEQFNNNVYVLELIKKYLTK